MDLDPRGYEGGTDLDKIKAERKVAEVRSVRYSTAFVLLAAVLLLLLAVWLIGERRGSVMSKYGYPPASAGGR